MIYNDGSTSAVTVGMSTLTTGVISKYTDDSYDKSWGHIVGTALFDAGSSVLTSNSVRVQKVTVGRGNMNAVFRAGLTKIKRHQAKRMSSRVMRKGFFSRRRRCAHECMARDLPMVNVMQYNIDSIIRSKPAWIFYLLLIQALIVIMAIKGMISAY